MCWLFLAYTPMFEIDAFTKRQYGVRIIAVFKLLQCFDRNRRVYAAFATPFRFPAINAAELLRDFQHVTRHNKLGRTCCRKDKRTFALKATTHFGTCSKRTRCIRTVQVENTPKLSLLCLLRQQTLLIGIALLLHVMLSPSVIL